MALKRNHFPLFALLLAAGCETPLSETQAIRQMSSPLPDSRRNAIAAMVTLYPSDGKTPVYVARYRQLAAKTGDTDVTVRAMAIRALNICRDGGSTAIFVARLSDEDETIRLESAKALANVPDPAAVPVLIERLRGTHPVNDNGDFVPASESRDVRIAAADALRNYKQLDVEQALTDTLSVPEFDIAWQAHASLVTITGRDLNYDEGAWLQSLARPI